MLPVLEVFPLGSIFSYIRRTRIISLPNRVWHSDYTQYTEEQLNIIIRDDSN